MIEDLESTYERLRLRSIGLSRKHGESWVKFSRRCNRAWARLVRVSRLLSD